MTALSKTVLCTTIFGLAALLGAFSANANSGLSVSAPAAAMLDQMSGVGMQQVSEAESPPAASRQVIRVVGAPFLPPEDQHIELLGARAARATHR